MLDALTAADARRWAVLTRAAFAAFSGLLHLALSYWFNYRWVNTPPNGVDGGPLGFDSESERAALVARLRDHVPPHGCDTVRPDAARP